jgi:malonyl-CoA O-methyltransferase
MTNTQPPESDQLPPWNVQASAQQRQLRRLTQHSNAPWLHQEVGKRLADKLDAIRLQPRHWLDWGAWLGGAHELVAKRYPQAQFWAWEPNEALASRTGQSLSARQTSGFWRGLLQPLVLRREVVVQSPQADALGAVKGWPETGVDMLWANMALHAAPDLSQRLAYWHQAMAVQGFLMCSGLGPDTLKELRQIYRDMGWGLCGHAFMDMHDIGDALVHAGFAEPVMDMEHLTLTWPDAHHLLDELRTWGGNIAIGRFPGCRTPRWRQRLLDTLTERLKGPDGRLSLTVEVIYGHAIKPQPRVPVAQETRVSLDDMRQLVKQRPNR